MKEIYCVNSGVHLVLVNVRIGSVTNTQQKQLLHVVYAGREEQVVHYTGVVYSAFGQDSKGLCIDMAERLPLQALHEPRHNRALIRVLKDGYGGGGMQKLMEQAQQEGCQLFMHYVGEKDEYPVLARSVSISDGNAG